MKIKFEIEMDFYQAFEALCEVLHMKRLVNEEGRVEIKNGMVYVNGKAVDDRPDLFAALRNVANAYIPNLEFRSDSYITHYGDEADE